MTIRDMWTYDHAPQGSADLSAGTSLSAYSENSNYNLYTGLPGMLYKNTSGTGAVTTDGFLTLTTASGLNPALFVRANEVQNWGTPTKYWIGFRTKTTSQNGAACNIFALTSDVTSMANYAALLQETDMTAAGAATLNTEYYVEIFIDRANLVYQVWVNGVQVKNGTLSAASLPANGVGYYQWGAYNSLSGVTNGATRCFRDFYFLDVDATDTGRLGSIRSSLQPLATISAPNYSAYHASVVGTAGLSTAQAKFGSRSFVVGATAGSCAQIADVSTLRLTGDFTIEFFTYNPTPNSSTMYLNKGTNAYVFNNAGSICASFDPANSLVVNAAGKLKANQWQHIALTKQGTTVTMWVDGVSVATATSSGTFGNVSSPLQVGTWNNATDALIGFLDELRISNVCRYTSAFTPTATPFVTDANTVLLMHFESTSNGLFDSGLSALQSIQTPYPSSGSPNTPVLQDAPTKDPMTVGFNTSYLTQPNILAVDYRLGLQTPYPSSSVAAQLQQGANNVPASLPINDNSMNLGRRVALLRSAPDSGNWTPAKIAATSLVVTPAS